MGAYDQVEALLGQLSDEDLGRLVGAVLAEKVDRGSDHDTALSEVVQAAVGGFNGSRAFDRQADDD